MTTGGTMKYFKCKLLFDIKHCKGNLKKGEVGDGQKISDKRYIVWFEKHHREFYWYPLFLNQNEFEII